MPFLDRDNMWEDIFWRPLIRLDLKFAHFLVWVWFTPVQGVSLETKCEPNFDRININAMLQALEKYNIEKDIAAYIKKEFDKKYNPTWHCIVGRNFGSYVTHETRSV